MTIAFRCEQCGKAFSLDDSLGGKVARCKDCGLVLRIPMPDPPSRIAGTGNHHSIIRERPSSSRPRPRSDRSDPPEDIDDPFGFNEKPAPWRDPFPPAAPPDDAPVHPETLVDPRPVTYTRKKNRKRRKSGPRDPIVGGNLILGGMLLVGALFAVAYFVPSARIFAILVLALISIGLSNVGQIGILVVAFRESLMCGLLSMFMPLYGLYYLITRWDRCRAWFLIGMGGWAVGCGGVALFFAMVSGNLPAPSLEPLTPQNVESFTTDPQQMSSEVVVGEYERLMSALIQSIEEKATLLATVNDSGTARQAAPRHEELSRFIDALRRRRQHLPPMSKLDSALVVLKYQTRLEAANERFNRQLARAQTSPEILNNLEAAGVHLFENNGAPAAASNAFGGIPHTGPTITVVVTGIHDTLRPRPEVEAIAQNFLAIAQALSPGQSANVSMTGTNDRRIYSISPVEDPKAFADRITCGRVTRVAGRRIDVLFIEPAKEPDAAP